MEVLERITADQEPLAGGRPGATNGGVESQPNTETSGDESQASASRARRKVRKRSKKGKSPKDTKSGKTRSKTPPKAEVTEEQIWKGLSCPGYTADGQGLAYLQISITNTNMEDASLIARFPHLQTVLLQDNQLTDITALGALVNLTHLDASNNRLRQALHIQPPTAKLRTANLSNNAILDIPDLSSFPRLSALVLDGNRIERISGLSCMPCLTKLSARSNLLTNCRGLEQLPVLQMLDLEANRLTSLAALSSLSALTELRVMKNQVPTLCGLQGLSSLVRLDCQSNLLPGLEAAAAPRHSPMLKDLKLLDNPLQDCMDLRTHAIYLFPQVVDLDGKTVRPEEKVSALNMHGADARALKEIRTRFFPNGELDDGGGAILPKEAGLTASDGIEAGEPVRMDHHDFADLTQKVLQVPRTSAAAGIAALAKALVALCKTDLDCAWACFRWICGHVVAPSGTTWQVGVPVFGMDGQDLEEPLLAEVTGTWSEKVSWLYSSLCQACSLEAVQVAGYWKHEGIFPGEELVCHNHCWCAVKVGARWRLVDPSEGALQYGCVRFFCPPENWIVTYLPLAAHWQLLAGPLMASSFWNLAWCSVDFFNSGLSWFDDSVSAVNYLAAPREGSAMPTFVLPLVVPDGCRVDHRILDASGKACAERQDAADWAAAKPTSGSLLFHQVVAGDVGAVSVDMGSRKLPSRVHQLWAALPCSGEWIIEMELTEPLPSPMQLEVAGLPDPLRLTVLDSRVAMRTKVVVPPVVLHDDRDGVMVDKSTPPCWFPTASAGFAERGCQLLEPGAEQQLEEGKTCTFKVVVPGASAVAVGTGGPGWHLLQPLQQDGAAAGTFCGSAVIAAPQWVLAVGQPTDADDSSAGESSAALRWEPLLTWPVLPAIQHIVLQPHVEHAPDPDDHDHEYNKAKELFNKATAGKGATFTRGQLLVAIRKDRKVADFLRIPAHIKANDGTLEKFIELFLKMNLDKLGSVSFNELAAYMGVKPRSDAEEGTVCDTASTSVWSMAESEM